MGSTKPKAHLFTLRLWFEQGDSGAAGQDMDAAIQFLRMAQAHGLGIAFEDSLQ